MCHATARARLQGRPSAKGVGARETGGPGQCRLRHLPLATGGGCGTARGPNPGALPRLVISLPATDFAGQGGGWPRASNCDGLRPMGPPLPLEPSERRVLSLLQWWSGHASV